MSRGYIGQSPNYACDSFSSGMSNAVGNIASAIDIKNKQNMHLVTPSPQPKPQTPMFNNVFDGRPCEYQDMFKQRDIYFTYGKPNNT